MRNHVAKLGVALFVELLQGTGSDGSVTLVSAGYDSEAIGDLIRRANHLLHGQRQTTSHIVLLSKD
jgi:hypothetical protein